VYALKVFKIIQKLFTALYKLLTFYLLLGNYLLILKMLTETFLKIPFSVIGRRSLVLSLAAGKMCMNKLVKAVSGMILQNHWRLPVSISGAKSPF
jgi:hypothetical protein